MKPSIKHKVDEFFSQFRVRKYKKGQVLILSGDGGEEIYYLTNGRVKQYDVSDSGDEIVINVFKPPAFFPMSLAVNKSDNPYIYEADTDVELRQAPTTDTLNFLKNQPDVLFDLLSRVYRGVDGVLARMVHLMKSDARQRLMFEILLDSRRFGQPSKGGGVTNRINESDIASRAGLSRETVSREMKKLSKEGLISFSAGILAVPDSKLFEKELRKLI